MERWTGRVALVTGASNGIGASVSRELVRKGMTVVGCARSVHRIRAIAEENDMKKASGKLIAIKCDLRMESNILALFKEIRSSLGRLDICINSAGVRPHSPLLTGQTSDWKNMLDVDVLALSICTREAVKLMRERNINDGQIVHINSFGSHRFPTMPGGFAGIHFCCCTKFMVASLTEGLRNELKDIDSKIRVSSISPGVVDTESFIDYLKNYTPIKAEELLKSIKVLETQDVTDAIIYILSTPPHLEVHDILIKPIQNKAALTNA